MNSEHLTHIVQQPDTITGQDALELEELCRKFPAYPTPFILLARYYQQTGDYRAEETIQKAALRVHSRAWLSDFVMNRPTESGQENELQPAADSTITEPEVKPEEIIGQSNIEEPLAEIETAAEIEDHVSIEATAPAALAEITAEETLTETQLTKTEEELPVSEEQEVFPEPATEENVTFNVSSLFVPVDPEEWVFDEIDTLETGKEAVILGFVGTEKTYSDHESSNILPNEMPLAGGLIQPFAEANETIIETKSEIAFEATAEIMSAAPYQIEKYYPSIQPENTESPTDFYSWLNNPAGESGSDVPEADEIEKIETHRLQQQSIIDRFIQSDPGVIRPKKEFFTPETAAKKSEHLPENLATETLAKVYLQQGNFEGAIRIYERLMLKFPEKNAYFADLIQKIKKENNP